MTRNRRHKAEVRAHQAATDTPYMVARRQITPPTLAEVMQQHPLLTAFGIGVYASRSMTPEQRATELATGRERLAAREAAVAQTARWLRENIAPITTPTVGSYALKHVVERATGDYLTNGELIAAALVAGYTVAYTEGPNVLMGMSARDVKRLGPATRQTRPKFRIACCLCRKPIPLAADIYALDAEWQRRFPTMVGNLACPKCAALRIQWRCRTHNGDPVEGHLPSLDKPDCYDSVDHLVGEGTHVSMVENHPHSAVLQGAEEYLRWNVGQPGRNPEILARIHDALDQRGPVPRR